MSIPMSVDIPTRPEDQDRSDDRKQERGQRHGRRRGHETEDEDDLIPACPECNKGNPYPRKPKFGDKLHDGEGEYVCENSECRARFDEPIYREPKTKRSPGNQGLARKLAEIGEQNYPEKSESESEERGE